MKTTRHRWTVYPEPVKEEITHKFPDGKVPADFGGMTLVDTTTRTVRPKQTTTTKRRGGFIPNIDTANEEIDRLNDRLGLPKGDFIPDIDAANDEIARLTAELPTRGMDKSSTVPSYPVDDDEFFEGATGLARAIRANRKAQAKARPPAVPTRPKKEATGLQRAINANIKLQESKSK